MKLSVSECNDIEFKIMSWKSVVKYLKLEIRLKKGKCLLRVAEIVSLVTQMFDFQSKKFTEPKLKNGNLRQWIEGNSTNLERALKRQ